MKNVVATALSLILSFPAVACFANAYHPAQDETTSSPTPSPQVMDARSGETVEVSELVDRLLHTDVIFLGEQHDNDAGHEFQLEVIRGLVERGAMVVISMEQFERDVQGVVNDYLAGRIDEEALLANSRPWGNYAEHYRPIIEFAKENDLPVIASNVPRRLASDVSRGNQTKGADAVYLPRSTTAPEDAYWENFQATMAGHGGIGDPKMLKRFYASQCLKDDAMAEAIADHVLTNPHAQKTIVHLCGHFHSDYGLGTAARVVQRLPLHRISVVTMETIPNDGKLEVEGVRDRGHFVFWTVSNETEDDEADDDDEDEDVEEDEGDDDEGDDDDD